MKLKMPEKVKEKALKEGYYALSTEVLPEFAGDYLIVSKTKILITHSKRQNHIKHPSSKNNRVYEANMMEFYFNDPLTLDFQLDFFKKSFLGK